MAESYAIFYVTDRARKVSDLSISFAITSKPRTRRTLEVCPVPIRTI